MKQNLIITYVLLLGTLHCFAQGFVNLNFENAIIDTNGAPEYMIDASKAIPGWTIYYQGNPYPYIVYNTVSLGGAA